MRPLDPDHENAILAACLVDSGVLVEALPVLRLHRFGTRERSLIWKSLEAHWVAKEELPSTVAWKAWLLKESRNDGERIETQKALDDLRALVPEAPRTSLGWVQQYVRGRIVEELATSLWGMADKGDVSGVPVAVEGAMATFSAASPALEAEEDFADGFVARLERYAGVAVGEKAHRFPTPLRYLNDSLCGGLPCGPGGLMMVQATTGIGKSSFVSACGGHVLEHDPVAVVVHATTEESTVELLARYDAHFVGIDRERLLSSSLGDDEAVVALRTMETWAPTLRGRLRTCGFDIGAKVSQLLSLVERVRTEKPEAPILLIVDMLDHFDSGSKTEAKRHDLGAVYGKVLSATKNERLAPMAAIVTGHAAKEWEGKMPPRSGAAESYQKAQLAPVILSLCDEGETEDPRVRKMAYGLVKNRIGSRTGTMTGCAELGRAKFWSDGWRRKKDVEGGD